jgi:hypothetical protein
LAVLRRAKNVPNASDPERAALLEDAEKLENWCAYIVIGAVFLEGIIAISGLCPWLERLADFLANSAVALGVLGELRFGNVAGTILKIQLADAADRATAADRALLEYRAQRGVSLEGQKQVAEALKPFAGTPFDVALTRDHAECNRCSKTIEVALRSAGLVQINWAGSGDVMERKNGGFIIGSVMGIGLFLTVEGELHPELIPVAEAIAKALTDAGVEAAAFPRVTSTAANKHAVHLHVCQKP